jgi:hypothetical protein
LKSIGSVLKIDLLGSAYIVCHIDASKSVSGISVFLSLLSRRGSQKLIRNCDPYGIVASPTDFPLAKFEIFLKSLVNPIPSIASELSSID